MPSLLDRLARGNNPALRRVASQATSATPGTRTAHTHGLTDQAGKAATPDIVLLVPKAADADGALTAGSGNVQLVKFDSTTVTVRAELASQSFDLYVG